MPRRSPSLVTLLPLSSSAPLSSLSSTFLLITQCPLLPGLPNRLRHLVERVDHQVVLVRELDLAEVYVRAGVVVRLLPVILRVVRKVMVIIVVV